jgi:hypothetical protein
MIVRYTVGGRAGISQGTPKEVLEALNTEPRVKARGVELLAREFEDVEAVAGDPGHPEWERLNRFDLDLVVPAPVE